MASNMVKAKRIRFGLNGEFRKTTVNNDDLTLAELELMAQRIFKLSPNDSIKIKYKDEDDVMVTIGDDTELKLAMEDFEILKFSITLNEGKEDVNTEQASQKTMEESSSVPSPQQPKQVENIHEFDPLSNQQQNHHFSQPSPPPPPPVMNGPPAPHQNQQHVPPPPPPPPQHSHQPLPHQPHPPLMNGPPPPHHLASGPPPPHQPHLHPSPQQHQLPPPPPQQQQQHMPQSPPQQSLPPHQQQQMQPPPLQQQMQPQQQQQQQQGQGYNPPPPPPQYMRAPVGAGGPPLQPPVHQGGYAPNPYSARKRYPS